jgi:hypothetical protein
VHMHDNGLAVHVGRDGHTLDSAVSERDAEQAFGSFGWQVLYKWHNYGWTVKIVFTIICSI